MCVEEQIGVGKSSLSQFEAVTLVNALNIKRKERKTSCLRELELGNEKNVSQWNVMALRKLR